MPKKATKTATTAAAPAKPPHPEPLPSGADSTPDADAQKQIPLLAPAAGEPAKADKAAEKAAEKAAASLKKVAKQLVDGGIVGDVLPEDFELKIEVGVKFPAGKKVTVGKELPLAAVLSLPTVTFPTDPSTFYTIIMVDPDAPSRDNPINGEYRHFVCANTPGTEILKSEVLQEWAPPSPPSGSGLHRYVFLVYEQPERVEVEVFEGSRAKWAAHEWATALGMTAIGANYFTAQEK